MIQRFYTKPHDLEVAKLLESVLPGRLPPAYVFDIRRKTYVHGKGLNIADYSGMERGVALVGGNIYYAAVRASIDALEAMFDEEIMDITGGSKRFAEHVRNKLNIKFESQLSSRLPEIRPGVHHGDCKLVLTGVVPRVARRISKERRLRLALPVGHLNEYTFPVGAGCLGSEPQDWVIFVVDTTRENGYSLRKFCKNPGAYVKAMGENIGRIDIMFASPYDSHHFFGPYNTNNVRTFDPSLMERVDSGIGYGSVLETVYNIIEEASYSGPILSKVKVVLIASSGEDPDDYSDPESAARSLMSVADIYVSKGTHVSYYLSWLVKYGAMELAPLGYPFAVNEGFTVIKSLDNGGGIADLCGILGVEPGRVLVQSTDGEDFIFDGKTLFYIEDNLFMLDKPVSFFKRATADSVLTDMMIVLHDDIHNLREVQFYV